MTGQIGTDDGGREWEVGVSFSIPTPHPLSPGGWSREWEWRMSVEEDLQFAKFDQAGEEGAQWPGRSCWIGDAAHLATTQAELIDNLNTCFTVQ